MHGAEHPQHGVVGEVLFHVYQMRDFTTKGSLICITRQADDFVPALVVISNRGVIPNRMSVIADVVVGFDAETG